MKIKNVYSFKISGIFEKSKFLGWSLKSERDGNWWKSAKKAKNDDACRHLLTLTLIVQKKKVANC